MSSLRQIRAFVAVFEEGSFTGAATREGATQSGMSQHVKTLEESLGVGLFTRDGRLVVPTVAGRRYYAECVAILRRLEAAGQDIARLARIGGEVKVGLMPTFTRAVLAPALRRFLAEAEGAEVRVLEAYSAVLTEQVRKGELDFAIVPAFSTDSGLTATKILRNREMLVASRGRIGRHLEPVRLADLGPINIVVPGAQNTRRRNIDTYLATNSVAVRSRVELDAMMGTLDFIAQSDWVAILPGVLMAGEKDSGAYDIRPLADPSLYSDFVLIEPARRMLSPAARLFADLLSEEAQRIGAILPN